jgi:hypothetical protein
MPPPSIWGPPLWKVLHGIGVMSGRNHSLRNDSEREALWLIAHLEYILPCKECTEHYLQFKKTHPIPKSYTTLGEWICALHNSVNVKLNKETIPFSPEGTADVKGDWALFLASVKDSILLRLIHGDKLREYARHMLLWIQYSI